MSRNGTSRFLSRSYIAMPLPEGVSQSFPLESSTIFTSLRHIDGSPLNSPCRLRHCSSSVAWRECITPGLFVQNHTSPNRSCSNSDTRSAGSTLFAAVRWRSTLFFLPIIYIPSPSVAKIVLPPGRNTAELTAAGVGNFPLMRRPPPNIM